MVFNMSRFLKIEFNRVFKSKSFLAALALGFLIVLVQQITVARYYSSAEENVFLYLTGYVTQRDLEQTFIIYCYHV